MIATKCSIIIIIIIVIIIIIIIAQYLDSKKLHFALSGDFLYVTYTMDFTLGGPDFRVSRTDTPPTFKKLSS